MRTLTRGDLFKELEESRNFRRASKERISAVSTSLFHSLKAKVLGQPSIGEWQSPLSILFLSALSWAICATPVWAAPRITKQPLSVAVLMGSNATFRVTATGALPLGYQWQLDGREVAAATNASLVVSNVALVDFGNYSVVVRDASDQTNSQPAALKLARWTQLIVFDASMSLKEYSNGSSWVEWFAERTGLTMTGQVRNFATGGARTVDVGRQIDAYLRSAAPGPTTLLAPWWAGMSSDLAVDYQPVGQSVSNYAANIEQLAKGGGKVFVLPTLVPLFLNPSLNNAYCRSLDYTDINARMDREIARLKATYNLTIFRFDFARLGIGITTHPTAYAFTNAFDAANACSSSCDPDKFAWWDGAHPTTKFHHLISDETYRSVTLPLVIKVPSRIAAGGLEFQWQGGSPPFRLQQSDDISSGMWQSGEPSFESKTVAAAMQAQQFFRVQQLGQ